MILTATLMHKNWFNYYHTQFGLNMVILQNKDKDGLETRKLGNSMLAAFLADYIFIRSVSTFCTSKKLNNSIIIIIINFLLLLQDPGTTPAKRIWTSIDMGTEIYVSNKDEMAEWTLSDFDVLLTSPPTDQSSDHVHNVTPSL